MESTRLSTELPRGVILRDPQLLASGCCGYGEEYSEIVDPATYGGVITKAVSFETRPGNKPPRLRETPAGLLNCIGLQNPGAKVFCDTHVPRLVDHRITFICNVVGHSIDEFAKVTGYIEQQCGGAQGKAVDGCTTGLVGYELDLSCPNVESGTMFATDLGVLNETVRACRRETDKLMIAKLSPNVTDIVPYAQAARDAGADAVTIANTWQGVSIDIHTRKSHVTRPSAGLSGAAIRPATLYQVWRCHRAVPDLPIIGCGGITDTDSAVQYLLAGATAIQLGTGLFLNPRLPLDIQQGLASYLDGQNEPRLADIIGTYRDNG